MKIRSRVKSLRHARASELIPSPANWRTHPQAQQDALRGVLTEIGYADALIARETAQGLQLLDGHLRAETTPDAMVPVLIVDLDDAEAAKLLATLDPLAAMAGTDGVKLAELLNGIETDSEAVQAMLDELIADAGMGATSGEIVEDVAPEPPAKPISTRGDLWLLGEHRLLCGDATEQGVLESLFGSVRPRLVMTSPPYNQKLDKFKPSGMQKENPGWVNQMASAYSDSLPEPEYQEQQISILNELHRLTSDDASIFYNHKHRYRDKRVLSPMEWLARCEWRLRQEIIWDRSGSITLNARMFMPCDERIYWLTKGGFLFNDETSIKSWSTVWRIAPKAEVAISAPYPVEIAARPLQACSESGDVVCDPYSGSGTTIIAAEQLGRRCYGLEIDPAYCDVVVQRWESLTGKKAKRAGTPTRAPRAPRAKRTRTKAKR